MSFIKFSENEDTQLVTLVDALGNQIQSLNGALRTYDGDSHHTLINRSIHQHTATETTLAIAVTGVGSEYIITVVNATGFAIGDYIHIGTTVSESTHPRIINLVGNVMTLDRRVDYAHEIGEAVIKVFLDMSVLPGSLASPKEYYSAPRGNEVWHITRLLFTMVHATAGDYGLFGNLLPLTNGLLIRVLNNGVYRTFTNWKTNGDAKVDMFDVEFDNRSGGQGNYGTSGRLTFKNSGAVIRLDAATNDRIEVYVQDDVTPLGYFSMKVQGHLEDQ